MNILLLGGSNTGLQDGWAAHFGALAVEHEVTNHFLGATGSLFGLLRLLKLKQEQAPVPDLVIFEYMLNDILLAKAGCLRPAVLDDTLRDVIEFCRVHGIRLLFLCLRPQSSGPRGAFSPDARVERLYARMARAHGMHPCVFSSDLLGEEEQAGHYRDPNHFTVEMSQRAAAFLVAALRERTIPIPVGRDRRHSAFSYIDAAKASPRGACRLVPVQTKVFDGPFLEISRSGASVWPGRGRLMAILIRSTPDSGHYRIRATKRSLRKCAHSEMLSLVRKLVTLHYVSRKVLVDGDLEIAMPAEQSALMALREDRSLLQTAPTTPFENQILEVNGILLWRPASPARRLLDLFETLRPPRGAGRR